MSCEMACKETSQKHTKTHGFIVFRGEHLTKNTLKTLISWFVIGVKSQKTTKIQGFGNVFDQTPVKTMLTKTKKL